MMRAYYDASTGPRRTDMRNSLLLSLIIASLLLAGGCVYQANISQGNVIEQEDLDQVELGMTRNQVRFLLGTPMVNDPFHASRWDYVYFIKIGRDKASFKRWVSVIFDNGGFVIDIRKDQELDPDL
jgi:outer membrane protein assembly factor BamE